MGAISFRSFRNGVNSASGSLLVREALKMRGTPMNIHVVILLLAFLCFCVAAVGIPTNRVNMIGLGLALWVLSLLMPVI
jgi:hypothetical protein